MDEAYSMIDLPSVTKENIDFPSSLEISGVVVSCKFTTTSPNLTSTGVVTRGDEDVVVSVSVELSCSNQSKNYILGEVVIKKIESYTISYDLDGGVVSSALVEFFKEGEEVELPVPEKVGFTFLGWYEGNNLINQIKEKNYQLVAKWTKTVYHITYDLDGGTCSDALVEMFGDDMVVVLPTPHKEGFEFIGWYENNKQIVHIENRDYNLVAIYAMKKYTIIYDLNGGECDELITSFKEGDVIELPIPTTPNRTFLGWYDGVEMISVITIAKDYYLKAIWDKSGTIIINKDVDKCYVGSDAFFSLEGYEEKDFSKFNWVFDNTELLEFDTDYVAYFKKAGSVKLTVTKKDDPSVTGTITFEILNALPRISLLEKVVYINSEFHLEVKNYDDLSMFNITSSNEKVAVFEGGKFIAKENGKAIITFTLNYDEKCFSSFEVTVYDLAPVVRTNATDMFVGDVYRIDILNYPNSDDYFIGFSDPTVLGLDGNKIVALKEGMCLVRITLTNDNTVYTELTYNVFPVKPALLLGSSNLLVGGTTRLMITNLESLEEKDLDNFDITISNSQVALIENYKIKALAEGEAVISVVSKNNPLISNTVIIKVSRTSSIRDVDGEIGSGPLFLTMSEDNSLVHAGDLGYIYIDSAKDISNYILTSSDIQLCRVYDDGHFIAVKAGFVTIFVFNANNKEVQGTISFEIYGEPNVDFASRLIKIAEGELGYRERNDGGTKFADWYPLPGEAWCAMFVSWCADRAGISTDIIPKYCGCTAGRQWFEERGQFGYKGKYTPKAGDIIFFLSAGASHTGIVTGCDGIKVYTIEGNTSNMVARREYYLYTDIITGYGIPNYPPFNVEE